MVLRSDKDLDRLSRQPVWGQNEQDKALQEYVRLIRILDDEDWNQTVAAVEARLGHAIEPPVGRQNAFAAARAALDADLVEAVAEARAAGVPWQDLTDCRGWLSHNDLHRLMERAKMPSVHNVGLNWPQRIALSMVTKDVKLFVESDPMEAARLAQSAQTFLRRWVKQVPSTPPPEVSQLLASMHRPALEEEWKKARVQLQRDIKALTQPLAP